MTLLTWTLLVTAGMTGAGLASLSAVSGRRHAGLLAAALAVGVLLMFLGSDLVAVAWLTLAGAVVILDRGNRESGAELSSPASRAITGVLAMGLFALFYQIVLRMDWPDLPPAPWQAQTAVTGGNLLTVDLALLVGAALLLAVVLVGASLSLADEEDAS